MDQSKYIPPVAKQLAGEHVGTADGRKPWKTKRRRRSASKTKIKTPSKCQGFG